MILISSIAIGAAIFSSSRFLKVFYEKSRLQSQVYELNRQVSSLQDELTRVNEENSSLSDNVKGAQSHIAQLNLRNAKLQDNIFILIKEIQSVHEEKLRIKKEKGQDEEELVFLKEKNKEFEEKLHSIPELKKAIRELKIQRSKSHSKAAGIVNIKEKNKVISYDGNSGFLIKNGISTFKSQVKIEVKPVR